MMRGTRMRLLIGGLCLLLSGAALGAALGADWEALRDQAEQSPQALAQLQKAAEHGHPEAAFYMGTLYAPPITKGTRTVRKSWERALHWYRLASDLGCAKADFDLGLAYQRGQGVPQDPAMAHFYYARLMAQAKAEATAKMPRHGAADQGS